jgi:hypothetical protein
VKIEGKREKRKKSHQVVNGRNLLMDHEIVHIFIPFRPLGMEREKTARKMPRKMINLNRTSSSPLFLHKPSAYVAEGVVLLRNFP